MFGKIIITALAFTIRVIFVLAITKAVTVAWIGMKALWDARTIRVVLEK